MRSVVTRAALGLIGRRETARPPDPAALLSALPVPVVLLDGENRFRALNHAAEQFLGISEAQARGQKLGDFVPLDSPLFLLIE